MRFSRSARRIATRSISDWSRRPIATCARWSREASFATICIIGSTRRPCIIPPLRDRRDAIPAFVGHFVEQYCRLFAKDIRRISRQAIEALCAYSWPGNVRELAHAVESAVLMADGDCITLNELPSNVLEGREASTEPLTEASSAAAISMELPEAGAPTVPAIGAEAPVESKFSLDAAIREASKDALVRALNATHGNCHRAADLLGVSRYTVYRMLARYGLTESRGYRSWRKSTV